jgi:hypothetical protein
MEWLDVAERVGLPVAFLGAGVIVLWRFMGVILAKVFSLYDARIEYRDELATAREAMWAAERERMMGNIVHLIERQEAEIDRSHAKVDELTRALLSRPGQPA